ncbi:MAG: electron transfer flavoprotein subunit alpha/FixB family protein [Deltaproteobacteria bacterium]|nr:electron transfer flavoprotein subunit alpha/FixB family protein [Deltaproteobacteria bacterium]
MKQKQKYFIFAEQRAGVLHDVSLELVGKCRELSDKTEIEVTTIICGKNVRTLADVLLVQGADQAIVAESDLLEPYRIMPYTSLLADICKKYRPDVLLFGATSMGTELAPRLAARLNTGLSAHCIELDLDGEGNLLQFVPGWGAGLMATIKCPGHRPQIATVKPGVMSKLKVTTTAKGNIIEFKVPATLDTSGPTVIKVKKRKPEKVSLEKAEVIVAGGWGIGDQQGWSLLEELAEILCAAVGATRPAVDEGWAEEDQMIGQSGKTVKPKLYIGIGISGVMHHTVGMDESGLVVAINKDPKAPIFDYADIGVIADYRSVVPALTRAIKEKIKSLTCHLGDN